jgi:hypothetical protein
VETEFELKFFYKAIHLPQPKSDQAGLILEFPINTLGLSLESTMATSKVHENLEVPPPQYEKESHEPLSRTSSQSALSTHSTTPLSTNTSKSLYIHAHGIPVLRIPGPSADVSIPITTSSSPSSNLIYKAIRPHRWASSFSLHNADDQVVAKVDGDRFSNFPLRTIVIQLLNGKGEGKEEANMKRKALMTRSCVFEFRGEEYEWRYGRVEEGAKMNGHTLLVCEKRRQNWAKERVAQLVRDENVDWEMGIKKTEAGRGGRLDFVRGNGGEAEVLVVMSCLVMLKKEIDRRRNAHPVPITPAFSSGS